MIWISCYWIFNKIDFYLFLYITLLIFLESCKGMGNTIQELQHNATWNLGHTAWFVTNVYFTFVLFSSLIPKYAIKHCFQKIVEFQRN